MSSPATLLSPERRDRLGQRIIDRVVADVSRLDPDIGLSQDEKEYISESVLAALRDRNTFTSADLRRVVTHVIRQRQDDLKNEAMSIVASSAAARHSRAGSTAGAQSVRSSVRSAASGSIRSSLMPVSLPRSTAATPTAQLGNRSGSVSGATASKDADVLQRIKALADKLTVPQDVTFSDPLSKRRLEDVRPNALSPTQLSERGGAAPRPIGAGAAVVARPAPSGAVAQQQAAAVSSSSGASGLPPRGPTSSSPVRLKSDLAKEDHWARLAQEAKQAELADAQRVREEKIARAAKVREELSGQMALQVADREEQKRAATEQYQRTIVEAKTSLEAENARRAELRHKRVLELAEAKAARMELERRKKDHFVELRAERADVEATIRDDRHKEEDERREKKRKIVELREAMAQNIALSKQIKTQEVEQRREQEDKDLRVAAEMEEASKRKDKERQQNSKSMAKEAFHYCQSMTRERHDRERDLQAAYERSVVSGDDAYNQAQAEAKRKQKELDVKYQLLVKEQIVERERLAREKRERARLCATPDIDEARLTALPTESRRERVGPTREDKAKWQEELDAQMLLHQRKKLAGHLVTSIARAEPLI